MPRINVNIVTHNSANMIDNCLEAVFAQEFQDFGVLVVDNGSVDDTIARLEKWQERGVRVHVNSSNQYFARAHNYAIQQTDSEFVLTLNPDVLIRADYLAQVIRAFGLSEKIGSVNGKLLSMEPDQLRFEVLHAPPSGDALIDGAGLMMYPSRRPYLRGNRQPQSEFCLRPEYIFGVDAACGSYRRAMLEDVAVDGEYFDTDFVIYREDVDLAWRALLLGWDSYYEPNAVGYHVRGFRLGRGRHRMPSALKRHSVKNGWLLLIKNDSVKSIVHYAPSVLPYQLKITGGIMTMEWSSLGAVTDTLKLLPRMLRKRRQIHRRRRRSDTEMQSWFEETTRQA